jgi:acyl-CoA synthetase (AMP-forming)/AMP-acid ligase II
MVFPFTHIGGIGMLFVQLMAGSGAILVEAYDEEQTPPLLAGHGVTLAAGGTPLVMRYLHYQRRHPERRTFPRLRVAMGGAAPKPPRLHAEVKAELGGAGVASVYGLTEAPFVVLSSPRDPDAKLASSEGPASSPRTAAPARRARRARFACAARRSAAAISMRSSTPRPSTRTVSSAPATSAASTPRAS